MTEREDIVDAASRDMITRLATMEATLRLGLANIDARMVDNTTEIKQLKEQVRAQNGNVAAITSRVHILEALPHAYISADEAKQLRETGSIGEAMYEARMNMWRKVESLWFFYRVGSFVGLLLSPATIALFAWWLASR